MIITLLRTVNSIQLSNFNLFKKVFKNKQKSFISLPNFNFEENQFFMGEYK